MIGSLSRGFKKIETHISWVLLDEKYAYKIKKPVKFWFLDYSTLERRRFFCEEEVRLNSRLSPEIYLGVVPIIKDGQGNFAIGDKIQFGPLPQPFPSARGGQARGEGHLVDYAVKMVRLPEEASMERLLSSGRLDDEQIGALIKRVVDFHKGARTISTAEYDYAGTVRYLCEHDLKMFMDVIKSSKEQLERVRGLNARIERFIKENYELFRRRQEEGKVRECHGDMHSKNIYFTDRPVFIDCIEFNKEMRFMDVLWEVAYFAMDVGNWGGEKMASKVLDEYFKVSGEERLEELMNFHSCHMALVLGKVAAMKNKGTPSAELERDISAYIDLAEGYALKFS